MVWLAERADAQYEQQAAIKINRAIASSDAAAQLRHERQILASLDQVTDLTRNVNGITKKVGSVVDHIRAGKGTAGAFVWDDAIYLDLKEMVRDLKRNPWKFLWKE